MHPTPSAQPSTSTRPTRHLETMALLLLDLLEPPPPSPLLLHRLLETRQPLVVTVGPQPRLLPLPPIQLRRRRRVLQVLLRVSRQSLH